MQFTGMIVKNVSRLVRQVATWGKHHIQDHYRDRKDGKEGSHTFTHERDSHQAQEVNWKFSIVKEAWYGNLLSSIDWLHGMVS